MMYAQAPYDPFDFDEVGGIPVDQAWPQVPLMQDPAMRRWYELHPDVNPPPDRPARRRGAQPAPIVPGQRGGRRPGAGAPVGNTNAFKNGIYSRRLNQVARLITGSPELTRLIGGIINATERNNRKRLQTSLAVAYEAALQDPVSRNSINQILQESVLRRLNQIQTKEERTKFAKNNQTIKQPGGSST
jgi:hypothetical protein